MIKAEATGRTVYVNNMIQFTTTILQFEEHGDKTGWTYIEVPADIAQELLPGNKKAFRVKGRLDSYMLPTISLLPIGGGSFMMPLNAVIRKNIHKKKGAMLQVQLEVDLTPQTTPPWMAECLEDDPQAHENFYKLAKSHQNYFIKWIESAKTDATRTKRLAQAVNALANGLDFGAMIRMNRKEM
ncbi:MAG TPA: YdeI/OmpD-associated family protein [Chitinophagaceae bacterium]|nr:YdeI/OmpD-associated family protein [Chitinophagaceae bacterium]